MGCVCRLLIFLTCTMSPTSGTSLSCYGYEFSLAKHLAPFMYYVKWWVSKRQVVDVFIVTGFFYLVSRCLAKTVRCDFVDFGADTVQQSFVTH